MDRIAHDDGAVRTVRARLARAGRTDRPRIALPDDATDAFPVGTIRLVLDGTTRHAPVERSMDGGLEIRRVVDNARQAREGDGENRLPAWAEDRDLAIGRSVLLDVVEEGDLYGLRAPGESATYPLTGGRDEGLASIARDLEGNR